MSTVTSILSSDFISNSVATLNGNFNALNVGKAEATTINYKMFFTVGTTNADYLIANYTDIGAAINQAYADLPSAGGTIFILNGTYSFLTPIVFGTNGKFASLIGANAASTFLKWTPTSGNAITMNCGNPTGHIVYTLSGFTLMGSASLIAAAQTNTNTSIGITYGGNQGAVGINTHDLNVNGFGQNLVVSSNAYMLQWNSVTSSGGNGGVNGNLLFINAASNSGERNVIHGCSFTDPGNSIATNAIYITSAGTASNFFSSNSFDDAQVFIGASNGQTSFFGNHFENAAFNTYPQYIAILGVSSDLSTMITFIGNEIANDGNSAGTTFQTIIKHGGQLVAIGTMINNYGGQTITAFVDHSLDNGLETDLVGMTQVQGGGLTNLIAGSGGVAWSKEVGAAFTQNVANSYSIGMRAQGSNTNLFYSGSNTTGTWDHAGNWVLGVDTSSTTTMKGNATAKSLASSLVSVSGLPTPTTGMLVPVNDATSSVWGASVIGGGANTVLAFYNGTSWTVSGH